MSKIYRSLDLQLPRVSPVDLQQRAMGPQNPERPAGGFHGMDSAADPLEALSHLERREREAAHLLEDAQRQAEVIQRDAYREGFAQGERAGEKLALQKAEPVLQAFQELIRSIQNERSSLIRQHEQELIKVAYAIATQVLHTSIEQQPEVLAGVVEAALAKVSKAQAIALKVSPYDLQLLDQMMRKQSGIAWPPPHMTLGADETIGRGGCRIETEAGDIDATIETQLRVLKNALWSD